MGKEVQTSNWNRTCGKMFSPLPLPHYYLAKKLSRQLLTRQLRPCKALVFTSHTFIKACCKMKLKKIFSRRLIFQPEKFILLLLVCQIKPVMVCTALNLATIATVYLARLDVQSLSSLNFPIKIFKICKTIIQTFSKLFYNEITYKI